MFFKLLVFFFNLISGAGYNPLIPSGYATVYTCQTGNPTVKQCSIVAINVRPRRFLPVPENTRRALCSDECASNPDGHIHTSFKPVYVRIISIRRIEQSKKTKIYNRSAVRSFLTSMYDRRSYFHNRPLNGKHAFLAEFHYPRHRCPFVGQRVPRRLDYAYTIRVPNCFIFRFKRVRIICLTHTILSPRGNRNTNCLIGPQGRPSCGGFTI